jgi:hypothetical protein
MRWHCETEYNRVDGGTKTCEAYIGIQDTRLLGSRLDVRHRRLKDEVLIQSAVESLQVEIGLVIVQ